MIRCVFGVECAGLASCGSVLVLVLVDFVCHGLLRICVDWTGQLWLRSVFVCWIGLVSFGCLWFCLLWFYAVDSYGLVSCG